MAAHPIPTARRDASSRVLDLEHTQPETMFDLQRGYGEYMEMPYHTPEKANMLFGTGSTLADPRGLMQQSTPLALQPTAPAKSLEVTQPRIRRKQAQAEVWPPSGRLAPATGTDRSQAIPQNPLDQVSGAFNESDRVTAETPSSSEKFAAAHKLDGRMTFRGLPISIETAKGAYRHWTDAATGEAGKTKMLYAYGYIRRTKGLDGDHVDVFVGPNEKAENVYVIMTNKAPDFKERDEEKCMLGFDSMSDAKEAFLKHYNKPEFFHKITAMPFAKFEKRVFETYDGTRKKVAEDADFTPPTFFDEKDRGLPPVGAQRLILGEPRDRQDRISAQFGYHDLPQDTTAIGP